MEEVLTPIYISNEIPENVLPHDLHMDFELSTKYILDKTNWYDNTDIRYYQERYPTNPIIVHEELIRLVNFCNLAMCEPEKYNGEIPYENQVEIKDFYEQFSKKENIEIDKLPKPIVISTKDLVFNGEELIFKIKDLERKIEYSMNLIQEEIQREILKNDPLVLLPIKRWK